MHEAVHRSASGLGGGTADESGGWRTAIGEAFDIPSGSTAGPWRRRDAQTWSAGLVGGLQLRLVCDLRLVDPFLAGTAAPAQSLPRTQVDELALRQRPLEVLMHSIKERVEKLLSILLAGALESGRKGARDADELQRLQRRRVRSPRLEVIDELGKSLGELLLLFVCRWQLHEHGAVLDMDDERAARGERLQTRIQEARVAKVFHAARRPVGVALHGDREHVNRF